jgi:hypothetical protein
MSTKKFDPSLEKSLTQPNDETCTEEGTLEKGFLSKFQQSRLGRKLEEAGVEARGM